MKLLQRKTTLVLTNHLQTRKKKERRRIKRTWKQKQETETMFENTVIDKTQTLNFARIKKSYMLIIYRTCTSDLSGVQLLRIKKI